MKNYRKFHDGHMSRQNATIDYFAQYPRPFRRRPLRVESFLPWQRVLYYMLITRTPEYHILGVIDTDCICYLPVLFSGCIMVEYISTLQVTSTSCSGIVHGPTANVCFVYGSGGWYELTWKYWSLNVWTIISITKKTIILLGPECLRDLSENTITPHFATDDCAHHVVVRP